jgi:hypothetical protein
MEALKRFGLFGGANIVRLLPNLPDELFNHKLVVTVMHQEIRGKSIIIVALLKS